MALLRMESNIPDAKLGLTR